MQFVKVSLVFRNDLTRDVSLFLWAVTEASSLGMILLHRDVSPCYFKKAWFLFSMEPSHCKQRSPIFIKESSCGDPIVN
ncbi:hypothetical protein C4D60_Mb02t00890 [Musa balbisiana]|uniref:Uncharacterized protein n=1 Tax=Musa balbisiana TaxID=52838 RepID=A0A4V4H2C6_MUSBA|nr:hypothetical protein C4D60_Mb02t00890 [Musa balbisiana]